MTKRPSREEMAKVARPAPRTTKVTDLFPDAKEVFSDPVGDVVVKGNQHGELPSWLYGEASKAGVWQVWDNRDKVAGTKRPWFKDVNGEKAFWPPKGTPDPVILPPIEEQWDTEEEPF
jgi:hypothetical protein